MKHASFIRFCLVGIINTAIDIPMFVFLTSRGFSVELANTISTSLALTASFLLNRRFTFPGRNVTPLRIVLYFAVTLSGLWVLQPIVIKSLMHIDSMWHLTAPLVHTFGHQHAITATLPKLAAVGVTLVWNYIWYSRVVFLDASRPIGKRKPLS